MSSSTLRMQAGPITDLGQSSAKTISHARHAQLYADIIERPNQGKNLEKILYKDRQIEWGWIDIVYSF